MSAQASRYRLSHILKRFALTSFGFRPYSLRRGGATMLFQETGSMEVCLLKGRRGSPQVAKVYIMDGLSFIPTMKLLTAVANFWIDTIPSMILSERCRRRCRRDWRRGTRMVTVNFSWHFNASMREMLHILSYHGRFEIESWWRVLLSTMRPMWKEFLRKCLIGGQLCWTQLAKPFVSMQKKERTWTPPPPKKYIY